MGAGKGVAGGCGVAGGDGSAHAATASSRRLVARQVAIQKFIFDSIIFLSPIRRVRVVSAPLPGPEQQRFIVFSLNEQSVAINPEGRRALQHVCKTPLLLSQGLGIVAWLLGYRDILNLHL